MKIFLIGLTLFASFSSIAGTQDCKELLGTYTCSYNGESIPLVISDKGNTVKVDIGGEGEDLILDGVPHKSTRDNSENVSECKNKKEIVNDNYFRGDLKGSISILLTKNGVVYTMIENKKEIAITCKKNK